MYCILHHNEECLVHMFAIRQCVAQDTTSITPLTGILKDKGKPNMCTYMSYSKMVAPACL